MTKKSRDSARRALWAYAYDITLPDTKAQLQAIQDLLDQEHTEAKVNTRTWAGRMVVEPQVTRILVVSDSREQDQDVNHRLEEALKLLDATFRVSVPLSVTDEADIRVVNGKPSLKPS